MKTTSVYLLITVLVAALAVVYIVTGHGILVSIVFAVIAAVVGVRVYYLDQWKDWKR